MRFLAFAVFFVPVQNDADKAIIKQSILKLHSLPTLVAFAKWVEGEQQTCGARRVFYEMRTPFFAATRPRPTSPGTPRRAAPESHTLGGIYRAFQSGKGLAWICGLGFHNQAVKGLA